jgi:hypothetical protein
VQLFPEHDRRDRKFLVVALILSLLVHVAGGGAWVLFARRIAPVVAKLLPHPKPTPDEFVATSDAITIEKRTVPRAMRRTPAQRPPSRPRPRRVAQAPAPAPVPRRVPVPLPTLPPPALGVPTTQPTTVPTYRPRHGTLHHPLPGATAAPRTVAQRLPSTTTTTTTTATTRSASRGAFSPQQIAALDARFSKTIAQAQRALTDVPRQTRRPATTMKHYQLVMAGSRGDLTSAQGQCRATQTWYSGPVVWHYMDCDFVYTDGFAEHVFIPWPQRFARTDDPADHPYKMYPVEDPPPGWSLPHPFAFSRLVCIFYKTECQALVDRERANGDPNYAPP